MRWPLVLLIVFSIWLPTQGIVINEIMYNPDQCSDTYCEWIELYNNNSFSLNLSGWNIDNNPIPNNTIAPNGFLIIAKNDVKFLENFNASCAIIKISNMSLTNGGKSISLKNSSGNIINNVFYNSSWGANGNNKTLSLAGNSWRESLQDGGTPCAKNFEEHDLQIDLEKTDSNEITATINNNGLSDENLTADFYIDETYFDTQQTSVASFSDAELIFTFENTTLGNHTAIINASFGGISASAELNFTIEPLPNADVHATVTINQTSNEYIVRSFPENASTYVGVSVFPHNFDGSDMIFGIFMFGEEFDTELDVSDLVAEEIDFGAYDLCAEIIEVDNYNDTNLENNFVCNNFTIEPPATQTRKRIKTFIANENYGLNETLQWVAQIFPINSGTVGNLTITLQKRNSQTSQEILEIKNLNLTENIILSGNVTIPDSSIEGIYKIRAKFSYGNKQFFDSQDSGQFWLAGLKDLGAANFTILQIPESISFGGFKTIFVKFFSGNYNYDKLKFLVYGYPKQVLADTGGEGVSASDYDSDVAVELDNIQRGQEIYLALPAIAKQNCGNDYDADLYRTRVRAYDENGKPVATADTNLQFSGKSSLCATKESKTSGGRVGGATPQQKKQQAGLQLEALEFPNTVQQGGSFAAKAKIINNANSTKSIEVYSYVFDGQKLLTEGGWTANKQVVELNGKETKEIELENIIKDDAELGVYTIRIRAKDGTKNIDADGTITIIEKTKSETAAVGSGLLGTTGAAVYVSKTSTLNPVLGLFVFLLLIFVLILIRSK